MRVSAWHVPYAVAIRQPVRPATQNALTCQGRKALVGIPCSVPLLLLSFGVGALLLPTGIRMQSSRAYSLASHARFAGLFGHDQLSVACCSMGCSCLSAVVPESDCFLNSRSSPFAGSEWSPYAQVTAPCRRIVGIPTPTKEPTQSSGTAASSAHMGLLWPTFQAICACRHGKSPMRSQSDSHFGQLRRMCARVEHWPTIQKRCLKTPVGVRWVPGPTLWWYPFLRVRTALCSPLRSTLAV